VSGPNYIISITQEQLFAALAPWLVTLTSLPQTAVRQGDQNRAALPPPAPGGILMTIIKSRPLNTPVDGDDPTDGDPVQTNIERHYEVTVQLDLYSGPTVGNVSGTAFDWKHMIENVWHDQATVTALAPVCAPLYTNPALMAPLDDAEAQFEQRWILEVVLQFNPVISVPQQYANVIGPVNAVQVTPAGGFAPLES
jgi:hypothetical protein